MLFVSGAYLGEYAGPAPDVEQLLVSEEVEARARVSVAESQLADEVHSQRVVRVEASLAAVRVPPVLHFAELADLLFVEARREAGDEPLGSQAISDHY